jgi:hypothetical protein
MKKRHSTNFTKIIVIPPSCLRGCSNLPHRIVRKSFSMRQIGMSLPRLECGIADFPDKRD